MLKKMIYAAVAMFCLLQAGSLSAADDKLEKNYIKAAKKYRFSVEVDTPLPEHLQGRKLPLKQIESELDRFFAALEVLGENFVRKSGLKRVAICQNLTNGKRKLSGHVYKDCLYLNVGFAPKTVYHEMYHVFDNKEEDKEWQRCNAPGFRYRGSQMENPAVKTQYDDGFVNAYARTSEREDRAETFSAMITGGPEFTMKAQQNPVLFAKMQYIIRKTGTASLLGRNYWLNKLGTGILVTVEKEKSSGPKKK